MKEPSKKTGRTVSEGASDTECVRKLKQGETEAFEVLVRRYQKRIFNLAYRMLGDYDDAAEVAQEAFLSAYRSIEQFRGDANFSTWLYRITFNHASTRRKSLTGLQQRTVPIDTIEPVGNPELDPAEAVARKEIQERVQLALNSLDPDDAKIILLKDLQDLPYEDLAQVLQVPIGTVKSRLHRARQALKTRLNAYFKSSRTKS